MLCMLIAYDNDGNIVATLDHVVARDADGKVVGLVDFEAHESNGGKMRDIWNVSDAVGSGTWPEWLGSATHEFKVERDPQGRIASLVHKTSGQRRSKAAIKAAIAERIESAKANGKPADIRDLVGGPDRPLVLDEAGERKEHPNRKRPDLPIVPRGA